jgi:plasmid stabilization system protein ParE
MRPGLGTQFLADFDAVLDLISRQNHLGQAVPGQAVYRQLLLKRFPYRVIYRVTDDAIIVIAVAHQRRHPLAWQNQVQEAYAFCMAA